VLGEIAPNNQVIRPGPYRLRTSPTPSLKKKKIESLMKAHGSPTHMRVTAGGRIVPKDQSPLCHPRFGYSAIKSNGGLIKFAQNHPMGKSQWTQATQNGFVAQDVNGKLCQIVDGNVLPLNEVDGALQLFMPAPNLNITQRGPTQNAAHERFGPHGNQQGSMSRPVPPEPSAPAQINALELEYAKLQGELKDVDKTEVLHGRTMGKAAKDALVSKRRELVVTLDNVRKALKSIRDQTTANMTAPALAMHTKQSVSPPRTRLPAFLQQRQQHNVEMTGQAAPPTVYGPFFPQPQPPFPLSYGYSAGPPDAGFGGQPWAMPPPAMFVPPPPFDGSMSSASLPFPEPLNTVAVAQQPAPPGLGVVTAAQQAETHLPQHDGARSYKDLRKIGSPGHSHALPIKAPEHKGAATVKSNLNPMSPAYKPGSGILQAQPDSVQQLATPATDRLHTPLSTLHQLPPPSAGSLRVVNTTDETISPVKKSTHLASSSISSFETADFFPRNTQEYSTRKHAYPVSTDKSDDKENADPQRQDSVLNEAHATPVHEDDEENSRPSAADSVARVQRAPGAGLEAPAAPPGTPIDPKLAAKLGNLPLSLSATAWPHKSQVIDARGVPDRDTHNLSPKSKRRDWLFVEENPGRYHNETSSPEQIHACQEELCVTSSPYDRVDFSQKSREWIEGYQAGLNRNAVGADRAGDFLDGYCSGLLKSKPAVSLAPSTGSPIKSTFRRPSPAPSRPVGELHDDRRDLTVSRPALVPLEMKLQSMDTLKQAIIAPQNENAVLTPAADGPHVNEPPFNLGAWANRNAGVGFADSAPNVPGVDFGGFQFPQRTSSMINRQAHRCTDEKLGPKNERLSTGYHQHGSSNDFQTPLVTAELSGNELPPLPSSPMSSAKSVAPSSITGVNHTHRISSMASVDSNIYRQWPGHRVFSPHLEWKSASSVAHHAGLANGFFAQAQFDGTIEQLPFTQYPSSPAVSHAHPAVGSHPAAQQQANASNSNNAAMHHHGRFKEGSLDGITNPPTSPPPMARAATSPPPMSPPMSPNTSPNRGKAKDSPIKKDSPARAKFEHIAEKVGIKATVAGTNSPPGKRRWRDVWRGNRKDSSKDESL